MVFLQELNFVSKQRPIEIKKGMIVKEKSKDLLRNY